MQLAVIFWGVLFLLLVFSLISLLLYLKRNVLNPQGKGCEKNTAGILRKFGAIRDYKVLSDLTISVDGQTAYFENLLIGFFGILIVTTCGQRGEYYGSLTEERWTISSNDGADKQTIPNPFLQQNQAIALLRTLLAKNNIYKVQIENIVYISSRSGKTGIFISHDEEIVRPGQLGKYLARSKFEQDAGIDVAKLSELLLSAN